MFADIENTQKMKIFKSTNEAETEKYGFEFAKKISAGAVICLNGELGAGKTTFVKGLARGFGVTSRIVSPTYVIIREYEVLGSEIKKLYHLDLYRLTSRKDILGINLHQLLNDKSAVTVIEWPRVAENFVPKNAWTIDFESLDVSIRTISIKHT